MTLPLEAVEALPMMQAENALDYLVQVESQHHQASASHQ